MRTILLTLLVATLAQAQPYNPVVLWDRSGAGDHSRYGIPQPLGDQNNDRYADFAVWALGWGSPGQASEAIAELFHGGNPPDTVPYMTFRSDTAAGQDFWRFQSVGDLNGDGFVDWQVWMYREQDPIPFTINTYWGGPQADTIPDLVFHMPVQSWVYPAGDFNGDGFDDLYLAYIIGDSGIVLYGGNPMDTLADWRLLSPPGYPFEALPQSFGDLNGDGYSDFFSTTSLSPPTTFFFYGAPQPDTLPRETLSDFDAYPGEIVNDLNGDHRDDLVVEGTQGRFYIFAGRDSMSRVPDFTLQFQGDCDARWFYSVGDCNHDNYGDLMVIDDACNNLWGTLSLFLGHPWLNPDPAITIEGRVPPLNLIGINHAVGLSDVNGDHLDDFAIGAFNSNFDGFRGRCVILSGDTSLRAEVSYHGPELPQDIAVSVFPNPFNSSTTIALDLPLSARRVSIEIFNLVGQVVHRADVAVTSGRVEYRYDGRLGGAPLSTGLYFVRVLAGHLQATTKMMILR